MQEVQRIRMKRTRRQRNGAMNMEGEVILMWFMVKVFGHLVKKPQSSL